MANSMDTVAEWKLARQWLISTGVIPVVHPVTKPTVDLVDFARSLRDGVFLCSMMLKLKPGCLENFNPRPVAQHSFLKNITSFLVACKTYFNVSTEELFDDSDLYEVTNFGKVVHLLSVLSHTTEASAKGWEPFPKDIHHDYYQDLGELMAPAPVNDVESIYANLDELAFQRNSEVMIYDDPPVSEDPYGDSSIYEAVVQLRKQGVSELVSRGVHATTPVADVSEKKKYILQELYETEKNYVDALKLIGIHFYTSMKSYLTSEDVTLLFDIPKALMECHQTLLKGFKQCCDRGKSGEIGTHFLREREELLRYGTYAAMLPNATEKAKSLQSSRGECARAMQVCQERSNQRFSLSELLSVPIQRVLKYPLLVHELIKCAKKEAAVSDTDSLTELHTFLNDISKYINETKRDFEAVKIIEDIEQSLVEYKGPPLKECGRYRFDGELRIKLYEEKGDLKKRWAFLFDKMLIICKRGNIIMAFGEVKYMVKWVLNVDGLFVSQDSQRQTTIRKVNVLPFKLTAVEYGSTNHTEFSLNGKSSEHKQNWMESIKIALKICCPPGGRIGGHNFDLVTSEGAAKCYACDHLLWGTYHQGYLCSDCMRYSHPDCLDLQGDCVKASPSLKSVGHGNRLGSVSNPPPPLPTTGIGGRRAMSINGDTSKKGVVYIAKMRYEGNPIRAHRQYLTFEKDEQLEILDQSDAEWWEAISLTTGNKGKVPSAYLKPQKNGYETVTNFRTPSQSMSIPSSFNGGKPPTSSQTLTQSVSPSPRQLRRSPTEPLSGHPWFVGCLPRIEAENLLKDLQDGVFLIRESDQRKGEYAVGLRWKQHPKHIKILVNPQNNRYFVSDAKDFDTVAALVQYYQEHSLGYSFPGVDTTLRWPYWEIRRPTVPPQSTPPPVPQGRPPVPSNTGPPIFCEALYSFSAEFTEELSLEKHCHVRLLKKETARPQWWLGEYKGQIGLFPSNYVRELPSLH